MKFAFRHSGYILLALKLHRRISRRNFLGALAVTGVAGAGYMRFCEPGWLQVGRHNIPIGKGQSSVSILQLSDFHASSVVTLDQIAESVELGLSLKPDVICLTGDFITAKYYAFDEYAAVLKRLADHSATFACLGNHDGGRWIGRRGYEDTSRIRSALSKAGIRLLHNESTDISIKGRSLTIIGVGDLWAQELDAARAFSEVKHNPDSTNVLLSHNPDSKTEVVEYPWHVMLCGHTHGGQLYLPLIGRPFAPVRDKRFVAGLYPWKERWIHVTRGVGNLHGMRLNCPPEVSLITLGETVETRIATIVAPPDCS